MNVSPNPPKHYRIRGVIVPFEDDNRQELASIQTQDHLLFQDQATNNPDPADADDDDTMASERVSYLNVKEDDIGKKGWEGKDGQHRGSVEAVKQSVGDKDQRTSKIEKRAKRKLTIKELQQLVDLDQATPKQIEQLNRRRASGRRAREKQLAYYKGLEEKVNRGEATPEEEAKLNRQKLRRKEQRKEANEEIAMLRQLVRENKATAAQRAKYDQITASGRERSNRYNARKRAERKALLASEGQPVNIYKLQRKYKNMLSRLQSRFCHVCGNIARGARRGNPSRWQGLIMSRIPAAGEGFDPDSFCTALLHQVMRNEINEAADSFLWNLRPPLPIESREAQDRWEQETAKAAREAREARDEQLGRVSEFTCGDGKDAPKQAAITSPSSPSTDETLVPAAESEPKKAPDSKGNTKDSAENMQQHSALERVSKPLKEPLAQVKSFANLRSADQPKFSNPPTRSSVILCKVIKDELFPQHLDLGPAEIKQLYDLYCGSKASSQPQTATTDDVDFSRGLGTTVKENLGRWGSNFLRGVGRFVGRVGGVAPTVVEPGMPVAW